MYDINKLKAQMTLKGITQEQLAKAIGVNESTINQKINCKRDWTLTEILRLRDVLGREAVNSIFFE